MVNHGKAGAGFVLACSELPSLWSCAGHEDPFGSHVQTWMAHRGAEDGFLGGSWSSLWVSPGILQSSAADRKHVGFVLLIRCPGASQLLIKMK